MIMKEFRIKYLIDGEERTATTIADTEASVRYMFDMCIPHDKIISIEEVKRNV